MTTLEKTRESRKKQTAEVFTPPELTNEILDKLPPEVWQPEKTFCDPAAGNGNIILEVIKRKLSHGHSPMEIVSSVYAVELMEDNVIEMKERILQLFDNELHDQLKPILEKNIICHDALTWDFENWRAPLKTKKLF